MGAGYTQISAPANGERITAPASLEIGHKSKGGFSVSVSEKSGRKPISGKWDFDGLVKDASIVLAVSTSNGKGKPKSGHGWVMTSFGVGVTQGTWGVEPIWDEFGKKKTMHHVTAYKVMMDPVKVVTNPIPGAVWLFGTALAALGLLTRRRIAA